jgi:hypothetical protein
MMRRVALNPDFYTIPAAELSTTTDQQAER